MLQKIDIGTQSLDAYRHLVDEALLEEVRSLGEKLRGARLLHVNATPYGGGVSELLRSLVPVARAAGLDAEWKVIFGEVPFYQVTKGFHNALQGAELELTENARDIYLLYNRRNAEDLEDGYDFIIAHDPQTAAMRAFSKNVGAKWVWRCHIDTSEPNREVWGFLRPYVAAHDAAVFTMQQFTPPGLEGIELYTIRPAIDPLSPKNMSLPPHVARSVLGWIGVDLNRPLILQVSRFDPWKDPLGVIEVYRLVRKEIPQVQLALVGSMALDDPEGWEIYRDIEAAAREDMQLFVFTNLVGVGNIEVNAFQQLADVVIQKSVREGFGLVVSETLWKRTPVVAGRAGGIPLQLQDGVSGYLVSSTEECAARTLELLGNGDLALHMGAAGHEHVRRNFLLPRLLRDELELLAELA
jgi:trehalose synthase